MPEITRKEISKVERIIFKHPLLTDDHDTKVEYKCDCGQEIAFYSVGKPDRLKKCMKCLFGEMGNGIGIELVK